MRSTGVYGRSILLYLLTSWLLAVSTNSFVTSNSNGPQLPPTQLSATSCKKPVLVVGASGQVGRQVVSQLLAENRSVRAVIRNMTKAQDVFGDSNATTLLELVHADLGQYDTTQVSDTLDQAVEGCDAVISVIGTMRFSKWTDFLPWRLFRVDVSSWCNDRRHPYYTNYQAQKLLVDLAAKHNVTRFVRLTGLSVGLPAFSLVSVLFSGLLSMTSRYHFLMEQYLRKSTVPHVILRPGGLLNKERNSATTSLQVDPSGVLPPPARVSRKDVASLAIASCDPNFLPGSKSYTLAVRWVGDVAPKPQGTKEDGCDSAEECLQQVTKSNADFVAPTKMKPYGAAVALFFYSFAFLSFKVCAMASRTIKTALFRL